ncbi:hypothetical protein C349_03169 [Cryptococcus neoformans var. grubii Br795]|uniref:TIGR00297 family protein n=1 Tax=Cryptococcus neoformans Tu259-1 TaxID=1230072 RepID=A0A854QE56_CRYNE|nr:hypothetical protein C353_03143 [Cryptococcus neoformans var. grubii AD1-83a]OWZ57534.1 hypothetical protein C368_00699 [Cryptococcus neoformans var. grubii 125.91]OXG22035.1 hypothetical protein C361_03463 [Cryptococcus neoformans var. grubii Tu259-1]OXG33986.1 hypothetical protein C360_03725 [Cryptococcus neoformans var. grubii Bt15]OXG50181.1 hypothetical protein C355_03145 [Cryptococcus neoformans var. grubii Th84]OXG60054.1 hypothetical protein C354_03080 [Cryptococcus neoformans var. 
MFSDMSVYPGAAFIATALGVHGYRKGSLSQSGAIAAFSIGYGHLANPVKLFGVTMIGMYLIGSRATKIKADVKAKLEDGPDPTKPGGNRTWAQVLASSLPGLVAALLYRFGPASQLDKANVVLSLHPLSRPLLYTSLGLNATILADTLASELGILSSLPPLHIITFQRVPPGTNGAISSLGTWASAFGGAAIGIIQVIDLLIENPACRTVGWTWAGELVAVGAGLGILGSILDSLLGATLQSTYYNVEDKRVITDASPGYRTSTQRVKGVKRIGGGIDLLSNSAVNFVCGCILAGTGWWYGSR